MWIEIPYHLFIKTAGRTSRPARALWIEIISEAKMTRLMPESRPARALWIEIRQIISALTLLAVEAREGLVD